MATIRKRGPQQYQARIRITGYPAASKTLPTRQEALAWATHHELLILRGHGDSSREAAKLTLRDALERYGLEVSPTKKGCAQEVGRIRAWQKNPLAVLPLSRLRGADLASYRDRRLSSGISGNTLRLEFALLSHLYEVARKDWGLETLQNPVKALRKPKVARGRNRRLQEYEEVSLLRWCSDTGNSRLASIIILAVETAMRRGELVGLRWSDINLTTRMANLQDTKNGEARAVPLSSRALAGIHSLPKESLYTMLGMHADTVTWDFGKACKACGITGLRFHDLRHEATSRLFEKGFNMMEVSTITGHKSLSMLKRYTHLRPSDLLARLG
ncbi:MAG: site-specific recombinase, phage integrase family [Herminiimonas sp.]|nr:site-specific recombinase, phage integrase family [Herminiimonas sp.]